MLKIAVAESDDLTARTLIDCLDGCVDNDPPQLRVVRFPDAARLLERPGSVFDLILLDPALPGGMEAARQLRAADRSVTLVFVADTPQYALEGYSVQAFDYILTPIGEPALRERLARAVAHVLERVGPKVIVRSGSGLFGLEVRKIKYVEVKGHYLNWHVWQGSTYCVPGSLRSAEQQLPDSFCAISRWYIVNMQYVEGISGDSVLLEGEKLQIGRSCKQRFLREYSEYLSGTGV